MKGGHAPSRPERKARAAGAAIDWFYARPGCESCDRTRAELERRGIAVREQRSTKRPLDDSEVRVLLESLDEVWILRGARIDRRDASTVRIEELHGPSGRVRAPLLRRGRRLLAGYGARALGEWIDGS